MFRLLRNCTLGLTLICGLSATSPALALDVYLFRGLAGVPFSVGLDDLEDKLKASGIHAETHAHGMWQRIHKKILKRGTRQVALVGHSMGALSAMSLTQKLKGSGITVSYLGLIDIPGTRKSAPKNASWAEAYVSSQPGFSLLAHNPRDKNLVVNTRVSKTVHVTIDDSVRVHDAIISAVWMADASIGKRAKTMTAYAAATAKNPARIDPITTSALK